MTSNEYKIELAGNPNVGKTSLYNRLTSSFEHVGNWHGVTVERVEKKISFEGDEIVLADLPGLYSLTVYSPEEGISRDSVLHDKTDLIINVCEVNNLSRNLYLTLQLLELKKPVLLAVNMVDELKKRGKKLDADLLGSRLQIPVVAVSAKYKADAKMLMEQSSAYIKSGKKSGIDLKYLNKLPIGEFKSIIADNAEKAGLDPEYAAVKIMENDEFVAGQLNLSDRQRHALAEYGDLQSAVAEARFGFIDEILSGVITDDVSENAKKNKPKREKVEKPRVGNAIDKIVLNKYAAIPIFLLIMAAVFIVTFGLLGKFLSDLLGLFIEKCIYAPVSGSLAKVGCPLWITGILCDGIILGVGGILAFLPQIVLLFFFLALLEDSGYISRVAFMTDGFFRKIGLSGRSVFTMLMGFGCSATAVLTARGLEDEKMRKKTVLLTPFMSCSARLPVYSVIASAFFAKGQPFIIFGMYILGAAVAILLAVIFEKCFRNLKSGKLSFIMEMPPYRFPTFERIWQIIWNNVKIFLVRVGTVVFALNVIVYVLSNFSFTHGYVVGTDYKSIFEYIGEFFAPLFRPLGFGNWRAVTSLLSGLVAKEVVISSIESLGGVSEIFAGQYASLSALSFMVFTLLYVPCIATLAAIRKEAGGKWMLFSLCLQLSTAYVVSLLFYWTGRLIMLNKGLGIGLSVLIPILVFCVCVLVSAVKKKSLCGYKCAGCTHNCKKATKDGKGKEE